MTRVLSPDDINRALMRMAHQILENHAAGGDGRSVSDGLVLMGIQTRGVPLAERLAACIAEIDGDEVPQGLLDVTLYRDDYARTGPCRSARRGSPAPSTAAPSSSSTTCSTPAAPSGPPWTQIGRASCRERV